MSSAQAGIRAIKWGVPQRGMVRTNGVHLPACLRARAVRVQHPLHRHTQVAKVGEPVLREEGVLRGGQHGVPAVAFA